MKKEKRTPEVQSLRNWLKWRLGESVKAERHAKSKKNYGEALYCTGLASAYAFAILQLDRVVAAGPEAVWEEPKSRVRRRRRLGERRVASS